MPRNVEVKARVAGLAPVRRAAQALAGAPSEMLEQTDTFFVVPAGRLKVRRFGDGSGELIAYARPDQPGPKTSNYTRVACADADRLVRALAAALPIRGVVTKRREVFLIGRTRVHLDDVDSLGTFVELEVVLADDESIEDGERTALDLIGRLALAEADLIAPAYIDLLCP
jgi:predicted adenylyl cyclase CyaB